MKSFEKDAPIPHRASTASQHEGMTKVAPRAIDAAQLVAPAVTPMNAGGRHIWSKLAVGSTNAPCEIEADNVANAVMAWKPEEAHGQTVRSVALERITARKGEGGEREAPPIVSEVLSFWRRFQ
jgi:hypothetical protein